jgi:hypothetical protein
MASFTNPEREVAIDAAKIEAESLGHTLGRVRAWAGPTWYRGRCIYCLTKFDIRFEGGEWRIIHDGKRCDWLSESDNNPDDKRDT